MKKNCFDKKKMDTANYENHEIDKFLNGCDIVEVLLLTEIVSSEE